jgi:hypothetical protein
MYPLDQLAARYQLLDSTPTKWNALRKLLEIQILFHHSLEEVPLDVPWHASTRASSSQFFFSASRVHM